MQGSEATRAAARYGGQRALFLLLSTSWLHGSHLPWPMGVGCAAQRLGKLTEGSRHGISFLSYESMSEFARLPLVELILASFGCRSALSDLRP